jgi:DUF1680 family protein
MTDRPPLDLLDYDAVRLLPGPAADQLAQTHEVLMGLDEDSLLRPFRRSADLPAPGTDLDGWYPEPRFLAETFGQWISALSRYVAITRDDATREKVVRLLDAYRETIPGTAALFAANGNPLYFHDKMVIGLTDSAFAIGAESAAELLRRFATGSEQLMSGKQNGAVPESGGESYDFAETYSRAADLSGDERYRALAERDLDDGFGEPLARGENVLGGRHAYSHVNTMCSYVAAYLDSGDAAQLRAAVNGLAFVEQQRFVTGGYGPGETFLADSARAESIARHHHHFESGCGSFAHIRLTRGLLRATHDPAYGDSMERILYNAALGLLPLNRFGKSFYQSDYSALARKEYFDGYDNIMPDAWPCCSGTFPQMATDYGISSYLRDGDGVSVVLYLPSTVSWDKDGTDVVLRQEGAYPLDDRVTFALELAVPAEFELRFRIPAWTHGPRLAINGDAIESPAPGTFATVRREWHPGDRIDLDLPRPVALHPVDADHPEIVGVTAGPLALFAVTTAIPRFTRRELEAIRQVAPGATDWIADSSTGPVTFRPWFAIGKKETYVTYHVTPSVE